MSFVFTDCFGQMLTAVRSAEIGTFARDYIFPFAAPGSRCARYGLRFDRLDVAVTLPAHPQYQLSPRQSAVRCVVISTDEHRPRCPTMARDFQQCSSYPRQIPHMCREF